ncbi:TlpA family protein disulfide reductase [Flavobacterium capsici]|uniref:TlpA disulfide reductase family protein n=1 Tax=Flavobacterium capsici TaxID=3075618 RepID=A0AA96F4C1_9FLAO|nr:MULTISPECIES: TlpA disulfide reductase family protein [unclassified Flavobacterium]WNM19847.1 TlpA disulfide reductase family protein [Flavobacterium sp. PMR2A8]WNM21236.1 TlpA disulfide reductase family protein [Flavobacterium sp. PMTSA4]
MKKIVSSLLFVLMATFSFAQETMTFEAKIINKNGDILFIKDNRIIIKEIKVDEKGNFKATFPVKEGMYQLFDGAEYAQLFLKNGYNLKMTMDASMFDETIKFEGKGSKENNFLAQSAMEEEKYPYQEVLTMDSEGFKKALDEKKTNDFKKLESAGLDAKFVELQKKNIEMNLMGLSQYYTQISANKKLNNTQSPNFDYENHAGGKTSLESLKGKYVYIDVWATWCGPCRAEIPSLKALEESMHGKNIEFVSISVDVQKDYEKWKSFVTEKSLGGKQLYADNNWNSDFIKAFGINSIPRFILIDPTGKVIDADALRPSSPKLKEQLEGFLK